MNYLNAAEISGAGMLAQKMRVEAAAANIANMHSSSPTAAGLFQPLTVAMRPVPGFTQAWQRAEEGVASVTAHLTPQSDAATRSVHEPGHPDADASGMVRYPGVDHIREMVTVTQALRAYEANLSVFQASRVMAQKALEIGGQ